VHRVRDVVKRVYSVLETLGYKPVVVGTYALILQGWLVLRSPYTASVSLLEEAKQGVSTLISTSQ
jgi:hypothetical protein